MKTAQTVSPTDLPRPARAGRWLPLALVLYACNQADSPSSLNSSSEAGASSGASTQAEGGTPDATTTTDATSLRDAGADSSTDSSGSILDGGTSDGSASARDGSSDAPSPDAQTTDASDATRDASVPDAGKVDAAGPVVSSIYDADARWLCRPGLPNSPCQQTLKITDVHADGGTSVSDLASTPADVAVDCFYLYPTIDPGLFSAPRNLDFDKIDMDSVNDIFSFQAVPFRGACALYAPVYRQTSLNSFEQDESRERGLETAYRDVEQAFDYYLRHAAPGRPLVLIAHSQGAILTLRLLQRRFEGHPELLDRLVVAVLAGPLGGFKVPEGNVVGGSLTQIPLCTSATQTGCVLTYNSFAKAAPPNADYARINGGIAAGSDTGCTTPPGGDAGSAARLTGAIFLTQARQQLPLLSLQYNFGAVKVNTPYARYSGFYTARCTKSGTGLSYLSIAGEPLAGDVRVDPVPYNHLALSDPAVGLHALDYAFVSGDVLQAVQTKIAAHK